MEFRLPDLGEGLTEARLLSWAVSVGDQVVLDQTLGELETDKATTDIPSPVAGRVVELGGEAGELIRVGAVLVRFDDGTSVAPSVPPVMVGTGAEPDAARCAGTTRWSARRRCPPPPRRFVGRSGSRLGASRSQVPLPGRRRR